MKKLSLLIFILLGFVAMLNAQISVGARAGANTYNYWPEDHANIDDNYWFGYQFAGYAKIEITKKAVFMPELGFSKKSMRKVLWNGVSGDRSVSTIPTWNYSNIDMPLLFGFGGAFKAVAGLEPSLLTGAKLITTTRYKNGKENEVETVDFSDNLKKIDLSLVAGFEHRFDFGLNYGLRCTYSIIDISEVEDLVLRKFGLQLSVGYDLEL